jgi:hypothetical protein
MTPADDRAVLGGVRLVGPLATEEPHLTGMYRVFGRLTVRDLIPDEDAVRRLPRRPAGVGGSRAWGGAGGPDTDGARRRRRMAVARHLARVTALPALLLAILITVVAFTAGGTRCTRAVSLHRAPGVAGVSCRGGAAAPPPASRQKPASR